MLASTLVPLLLFMHLASTNIESSIHQLQSQYTMQKNMGGIVQFVMPPSIAGLKATQLIGTEFTFVKELQTTDAYTKSQISYKSNGVKISGVLLMPHGDGPFPLIVSNHGFIDPRIYTVGRGLKREEDALAKAGFAVLHSDYRGHGDSEPNPDTSLVYDASLAYTMDVLNGIQALKNAKIPQINMNKIGIIGHSLGGGIALNIAVTYPNVVQAFVLYAPVSGNAWQNFDRWLYKKIGDSNTLNKFKTYDENPVFWDSLSANNYLENIASPIALFHGFADKDVPVVWSQNLKNNLEALNKKIEYTEYPHEQHEFSSQWSNFMEKSIGFFNTEL